MSWQEVMPIIGGAAGTMKRLVRYRYSTKFGAALSLPVRVAEACDWKPGEKLKLLMGGGEHLGKLRLASDKQGVLTIRAAKGGALYHVNLGRIAQLPEREVERVSVEYRWENKALEITLPDHALARPPSPRPAAAPPVNGKVDVVEKVVGANPRPPRYALQSGTR